VRQTPTSFRSSNQVQVVRRERDTNLVPLRGNQVVFD